MYCKKTYGVFVHFCREILPLIMYYPQKIKFIKGKSMDFEGNLKRGGLKITPQRMAILKEIQKAGHATIEEIYERILEIYPSISLATIYKNLASMCEARILNEIKPPLQKQRYELNHTPHSHLVCQICGNLQDIDLDIQSLDIQKICKDFEVTNISVALCGICKECKKD